MLGSSKLMAFAATSDAARAKKFYGDVLGLRLTDEHQFAVVFDAGGTMLRIQKVREVTVAPYTALGWQVPDIAAAVAALRERGVTFELFGGFDQDAAGVWTAPDGTKVAWFKDPDGNTLSVTQFA